MEKEKKKTGLGIWLRAVESPWLWHLYLWTLSYTDVFFPHQQTSPKPIKKKKIKHKHLKSQINKGLGKIIIKQKGKFFFELH